MLASVFGKSRPINYVLTGVLLVLGYLLYVFNANILPGTAWQVVKTIVLLLLLAASLSLFAFVIQKNRLGRQNTYPLLLYLLFLLLFPTAMADGNIIIANFFILLALRRLVSLQSLITPKEKIFDAALWIFIATIFHFWCIGYIVLVYISVIFHVLRDYRHWIIPFIALFAATVFYVAIGLMAGHDFFDHLQKGVRVGFDFTYFDSVYQNIAMALYAPLVLLFVFTYSVSISERPLNLQSSHKKILAALFIGIGIYIISPDKSNSLLSFTFAPMAIMGSSMIERQQKPWQREVTLAIIALTAIVLFILQL